MGREENDKTRTVAIIPLDSTTVRLRFIVKGKRIRGQFCPAEAKDWREVGETEMPAPIDGKAKISLQFYQGSPKEEHWARVSDFRILKLP